MSVAGANREAWLHKVRVYGVLIAVLSVMMFPFYTLLTTTFKPENEVFASPAHLFPHDFTISAYTTGVWQETQVLVWVGNSFLIAISTVVLALALAIPAGYATARNDFPGKRGFLLGVLVVQMFAPVVLIVGLFDVIVAWGLMDSYLSVIVPSAAFTLPFNIWMLHGYFSTIPEELEESARIDGAGQFTILRRIVIPLAKPGMVAAIIYTFLYAWNRLLFVLTFLTTNGKYNIPRGIFSLVSLLEIDWRMMLTVAAIGVIPILIVFAFLEEYIVTGMTSGAVKE